MPKFSFVSLDWIDLDLWEIAGTITGLMCVWLAAKQNVFTWPMGIVSALLYVHVFYEAKLYSDAWLQIFFAGMQVYGWLSWTSRSTKKEQKILRLTKPQGYMVAILIGLLTYGWLQVLLYLKPDAAWPLGDSFTSICSLVAVFLQAKKVLECWWLWILANAVYIPLYLAQNLYLTAALYGIFLAMAIYGFYLWRSQSFMQQGKNGTGKREIDTL